MLFRKNSPFNPEKESVTTDCFFEKNILKSLVFKGY